MLSRTRETKSFENIYINYIPKIWLRFRVVFPDTIETASYAERFICFRLFHTRKSQQNSEKNLFWNENTYLVRKIRHFPFDLTP